MRITLKWLKEQSACAEGVKWFRSCGETDGAAVVRLLLAAATWGAVDWANWLVARLLDRPGRIRYAVNAAESVLYLTGDARPQAEAAIAAAKAVLANDTPENRAAARAAAWDAAWATGAAVDAARAAAWDAAEAAEAAAWDAAWATGAAAWDTWAAHLRKLVEFGLALLEGK